MNMHKFRIAAIAAPLILLAFTICSSAQEKSAATSAAASAVSNGSGSIAIKNFGQMDGNFYRGAQPKDNEYKMLAAIGVKTIIDLRDDPLPFAKSAAEAANMRYINIPMSDKDSPKQESIDEFLSIANDKANYPFYVHCAGGRHRTGLMGAVYRFNHDGWDFLQAYQEMKKYDYYSRWGHGEIKKYVEQYWENMHAKETPASSSSLVVQAK